MGSTRHNEDVPCHDYQVGACKEARAARNEERQRHLTDHIATERCAGRVEAQCDIGQALVRGKRLRVLLL